MDVDSTIHAGLDGYALITATIKISSECAQLGLPRLLREADEDIRKADKPPLWCSNLGTVVNLVLAQ